MIHFFGDSFTYCQGCTSDHEYYKRTYDGTQKTWIELMSEFLNDEYTNYGRPGVGNQKIIDSVVENIKNIKTDDIVFLSRTHDERLQMPYKNHFTDILPGMVYEHDDINSDYYKTIDDYVKFILFPNFEGVTNRYNTLFHRITEYFESINVKCIRWDVENHTIRDEKAVYSIISDEHPEINDSHWSWKGHTEFFQYIKTLL
jgi:hypothetical protein